MIMNTNRSIAILSCYSCKKLEYPNPIIVEYDSLVHHEWKPTSLISFYGKVDTMVLDKNDKTCISMVLKP